MPAIPHPHRRPALTALVALTLTLSGLATAHAATQTISINPSQIGATLSDYSGGGTCPMITGYDTWHFVAPGTSTFVSLDVTFTGATAQRTVIGGDPNNDTKHAWVYTRHGLHPAIAAGSAVIDGSGSQFVLSHTCIGSGTPTLATSTTTTQASTSVAEPVEGDSSSATDVATVSGPAGSTTDPTGTVTFHYCVASDGTPIADSCTWHQIGSAVTLVGGTAGDGRATATLAPWTIPGAGYYLFRAVYSGDLVYEGSVDGSGASESFRMWPTGDVGPTLRYADMPRLIETGSSHRRCPSAAVGGKAVGSITVGDVTVPLKSATYRKGGVFHPPASAKIATISRRHQPLNASEGTTFIVWHVRWNKGCNGTLNPLATKSAGFEFTTIDADGAVQRWVLTDNFTVKKGHYRHAWFTENGPRQLVLITCADLVGGKFRRNRVLIAVPAPLPS